LAVYAGTLVTRVLDDPATHASAIFELVPMEENSNKVAFKVKGTALYWVSVAARDC